VDEGTGLEVSEGLVNCQSQWLSECGDREICSFADSPEALGNSVSWLQISSKHLLTALALGEALASSRSFGEKSQQASNFLCCLLQGLWALTKRRTEDPGVLSRPLVPAQPLSPTILGSSSWLLHGSGGTQPQSSQLQERERRTSVNTNAFLISF
jgi:hypothetical protein